MTYNVFGGTLSFTQSINQASGKGFYFLQYCSIWFASQWVLCVAALLSKQHSDDMKAVTHEVRDCKVKLDAHREYVLAFLIYIYIVIRRGGSKVYLPSEPPSKVFMSYNCCFLLHQNLIFWLSVSVCFVICKTSVFLSVFSSAGWAYSITGQSCLSVCVCLSLSLTQWSKSHPLHILTYNPVWGSDAHPGQFPRHFLEHPPREKSSPQKILPKQPRIFPLGHSPQRITMWHFTRETFPPNASWVSQSMGFLLLFCLILCHLSSVGCVAQLAERRSLAGELTLFYARPVANG